MPNAARLAAGALALACAAGFAYAQVLYKWVDADGRIQYSDTPPKNPKGPVTRIEPDVAPTPAAPAPAKPEAAKPAPKAEAAPVVNDIASQRRAKRGMLEARLNAARDKLEAAKKALAEAPGPEPDERQVFRQEIKPGQGGMHGLSTARSNCKESTKDGKKVTTCAGTFATDAYYERIAKLEIAVHQAEEELDEAETAWRRGVD